MFLLFSLVLLTLLVLLCCLIVIGNLFVECWIDFRGKDEGGPPASDDNEQTGQRLPTPRHEQVPTPHHEQVPTPGPIMNAGENDVMNR